MTVQCVYVLIGCPFVLWTRVGPNCRRIMIFFIIFFSGLFSMIFAHHQIWMNNRAVQPSITQCNLKWQLENAILIWVETHFKNYKNNIERNYYSTSPNAKTDDVHCRPTSCINSYNKFWIIILYQYRLQPAGEEPSSYAVKRRHSSTGGSDVDVVVVAAGLFSLLLIQPSTWGRKVADFNLPLGVDAGGGGGGGGLGKR